MIKIGALWKNPENSNLSGTMNSDVRILVLPNQYKKESKHPDFNVFLVANERKEGQQAQPKSQAPVAPSAGNTNPEGW